MAERLYPGFAGAAPMPAAGRLTSAWRQHAGALLLLLVGGMFAVNVFLQFPGKMSNDAINQYAEAVSGRYTDWHPPVMAWLWSVLRIVADGPAPLWLLHLALYWTGMGLFADGLRRAGHSRTAVLMVLAGAFPPFVYLNANLIKDVGMAAFWVAAMGLMFWFRSQQRPIPMPLRALLAALILYGTLVRGNALFGLGPLLMYAVAPSGWLRNSRLIAGALVIAVLAIPVTQEVNRRLFHPLSKDPLHALFLFDLVGIAAHAHEPGLVEPRATLSEGELKACYTPYWWDTFSPWGRCASVVHRPDADHATWGEGLLSQWATAIARHPLAYATHRLKHLNSSLLFVVPLKHMRLVPEYRAGDASFKPFETFSERDVRFDIVRKNPFFWPVTWLAWGAFLLAFLGRQAQTASTVLARVLIVSAIGYSGAYLVIGVATDMRYHYWSLLALVVATLLALPLLPEGWRSRSRPLLAGLATVGIVVGIGVAARLLDFQGWVT